MKNLTWQNPEQLFVAQELINKVKSKCCGIKVHITDMNSVQCRNALYSMMPDFEDMLQFESAYMAGCDILITRNKKHFPQDAMPVLTPREFFESHWPVA